MDDLGFLAAFVFFFVLFLVPWSIMINWMYNNTKGSLLLVAVLHGSEIWVAYWMMKTGINPGDINNYWGYGLVLFLVAIWLILRYGAEDLSRKHIRIKYPA